MLNGIVAYGMSVRDTPEAHTHSKETAMAQFVVDSDTIAAKSQQAQGHIERLTGEVNGMTSTLTDLQNSWTGTASANFQEAFRSWRAAQAQMEQAMAQINQALTTAGNQYAETEAANARMFAG
ncbi:hypothetical protein GCM10009824_23720 [Kocuria atrinae]|uniref:ESAT-6-like protein n=2 Tax=Kocuria atrinae TaxID=592377 RepID=A0ABN2Y3M9_9MICC